MVNCQKDDDLKATEYNQEKSQFKISYVGKAEIENNNLLNSKLNELTTDIKKAKINTQNKTVYSSEYDFYINTDYATYLENDDASYHSYTFNIIRSEEINGIENLVFSINSDNSYNTSIVKYNVSSSEKELIFDGHYIDLTNKISSIAIENNFNMVDIFSKADGDPVCISTDWQAGNECPYAPGHTVSNFINDNGSICSWVQAGNTLYAGSYVSSVVPCFNGFSGGDGINNTGNNSPNGTSSNGTNGQTSNGGSNSNGTVITSTTGPCRGDDCPQHLDEECLKITQLFQDYPTLINALQTNKDQTDLLQERGVYAVDTATIPQNPPIGQSGEVELDAPNGKYVCFSHTHNSPANSTYSVPSWSDIVDGLVPLVKLDRLDSTRFVGFLFTADGTSYAFTINNINTFNKFWARPGELSFNMTQFNERVDLMRKYFTGIPGVNPKPPLIQENSTDTVSDLKHFLDFINDKDMGMTFFEESDNFTTFKKLTHNKTTNVVDKNPCN